MTPDHSLPSPATEAEARLADEIQTLPWADSEGDTLCRGRWLKREGDAILVALRARPADSLLTAAVFREHRRCGTPSGYDGCYSHPPMPHCRADGMPWPCDVDRLRGLPPATASTGPTGPAGNDVAHTHRITGGFFGNCPACVTDTRLLPTPPAQGAETVEPGR